MEVDGGEAALVCWETDVAKLVVCSMSRNWLTASKS
jgi:hypothetical protein